MCLEEVSAEQVIVHAGDMRFRGVESGVRHQPMVSEGLAEGINADLV